MGSSNFACRFINSGDVFDAGANDRSPAETQPHQRLSRALNGEFRGVVMSREAAFSAQDYMAREDIEARLDTREGLEAFDEYSLGQQEGMGSLELLDGYPE